MPALFRIAWRHLVRSWRRSLVVVTAVAVGLAGSLVLVAWTGGLVRQMTDNAVHARLAHLAIQAPGYRASPDPARSLPATGAASASALLAVLDRQQGVHAAPRLVVEGLAQSARRSSRAVITGVEPGRERDVSVVAGAIVAGQYFEEPEASRGLPAVVIGREMADRLRVDVGDKMVLRVPGEAGLGAFRVRGIYRTPSAGFDRVSAFVRLGDAQRLVEVGMRATEVAVRLDDPTRVAAFQSEARALLAGRDVEILSWQEREPRLAALLGMIADTSWVFYGLIFVAAASGIANALLMAVYERIRELGIMRSLGLRAWRVVALVVIESALLTLGGTAVGLGGGGLAVLWLGEVGVDLSVFSDALAELGVGTRLYPSVSGADLAIPLSLATATALLAAIWPALKAVRLRPAEALRHV